MKSHSTTLAELLVSSAFLLNAQTATPAATATRPATTPPGQSSLPDASPPTTTTQTTGEASPDPTIKKKNEDEKHKVDRIGK